LIKVKFKNGHSAAFICAVLSVFITAAYHMAAVFAHYDQLEQLRIAHAIEQMEVPVFPPEYRSGDVSERQALLLWYDARRTWLEGSPLMNASPSLLFECNRFLDDFGVVLTEAGDRPDAISNLYELAANWNTSLREVQDQFDADNLPTSIIFWPIGSLVSVFLVIASIWNFYLQYWRNRNLLKMGHKMDAVISERGAVPLVVKGLHDVELKKMLERYNTLRAFIYPDGTHSDATILGAQKTLLSQLESTQKAFDDARYSDQNKSAFLKGIAAELKTQLHAMMGFTDLFSETSLDEHQREDLHALKRSSALILETVNDLLNFSEIESGEYLMNIALVPLAELVEDVCSQFEWSPYLKAGVAFDYEIGEEMEAAVINTDRIRVHHILKTLLNVTAQISDKGHIRLKISPALDSDGMRVYCITLSANGVGLRGAELEAFVNSDPDLLKHPWASQAWGSYGASALSLFLCARSVSLLGGEFEFSTPDSSSLCAHLNLPDLLRNTVKSSLHESGVDTVPVEMSPGFTRSFDLTASILVVEPDYRRFKFLNKLMNFTGVHAVWARSMSEALEMVQIQAFEIVLIEYSHRENANQEIREIHEALSSLWDIEVYVISISSSPQGGNPLIHAEIRNPVSRSALYAALSGYSQLTDSV
jgi:signal transduction histidine kinase